MTDKKLLNSLSSLGFQMFEPSQDLDIYETLAEVVKSGDTRLWEGFPALLANAADRYQFVPDQVEQQLPGKETRNNYRHLLVLSSALYSFFNLSFSWNEKLLKSFSKEEKSLLKTLKSRLTQNETVEWDGVELDSSRLKGLFELYFEQKVEKDRRKKEKFEEFSLEYALSQVFSPRQKELFKKKLEGLPFTKTEQEYYSRTVKKKVVALANSDLHSLAKKLLEH
jgi:hypothetical protein